MPENQSTCASRRGLLRAMGAGQILEGRALLCGTDHSLTVQVGPFTGVIPREEGALGVAEGKTREIAILSRVGKPVCFTVEAVDGPEDAPSLLLSRRRPQALALRHMMACWRPGQIIPATVTHLEPFGAFVDVGCGVPSMIPVEALSVSRIPHPGCRLAPGQEIAALLSPGMTVPGTVRGIHEYGAFIELFPNLSGLSEPTQGLREGDRVSVYIKSILPQRRKIKLRVIERLPRLPSPVPFRYFHTQGSLEGWQYH
jgi:small subunit ribosomal protein S1